MTEIPVNYVPTHGRDQQEVDCKSIHHKRLLMIKVD